MERAAKHGATEGPCGGWEKLCREPAMAASARSQERGRERGPRERAGSERGTEELGRAIKEEQERDSGRARGSGVRPWWGASSAWLPRALPLGNFPEHLAGDDVAILEPSFGHLRGIFGSRRLKQSG